MRFLYAVAYFCDNVGAGVFMRLIYFSLCFIVDEIFVAMNSKLVGGKARVLNEIVFAAGKFTSTVVGNIRIDSRYAHQNVHSIAVFLGNNNEQVQVGARRY